MNDIAIRVADLGKKYYIGALQSNYRTLRESMTDALQAPFRRAAKLLRGQATGAAELDDVMWALRDISFEVHHGDVVGIIGRNGAGKSTLLKILSRITEPTEGCVEIRGRVGCLLEVGTGFHPELTGRENVFLNGSILGMTKTDIERKFDEIVAFAEVDRFLDTPVKHYSSGMHVRLAFAVAAHLEPEILLIDEVLSVGDVAFQKKCLGKMDKIAGEGRTVLFVSHNLGAIANLCTSALWIDEGRIAARGSADEVIGSYLESMSGDNGTGTPGVWRREGTGEARVTRLQVLDTGGKPCDMFRMGDSIVIEFDVDFQEPFRELLAGVEVKRIDTALPVLHLINTDCGFELRDVDVGARRFRVTLPNCLLYPSTYSVSIWIGTKEALDYVLDPATFSMVGAPFLDARPPFSPARGSSICLRYGNRRNCLRARVFKRPPEDLASDRLTAVITSIQRRGRGRSRVGRAGAMPV